MKDLNIIRHQRATKEIFELPFHKLLKEVESPSIILSPGEDIELKKTQIPYFFGCEFRENCVSMKNISEYNYLCADFDDANMQNRIDFLEFHKINYLLYTSINHKLKGSRDRFRAILPLSSPISKEDWMILSRKIKGSSAFTSSPIFAEVDPSSFSSNRGFCFPVLTQNYYSRISLGGTCISLSTFEQAYNKSKKEIEKQEAYEHIKTDLVRTSDDNQQLEVYKESLLSEINNLGIDWSRDGVNGKNGTGTNIIISRIIGKLINRGLTLSEILNFRNDISRDFSYQHRKEWEYCAKKFCKGSR